MPSQSPDDYSWVFTAHNLPNVQKLAIELSGLYDALGEPTAASRVRRALFAFRAELESIATDVAAAGEKAVKEAEVASRKRPDTQGGGGPRLGDFLGISAPLTSVPGSVGVNFMPALDANVSWWWTQEQGYSGHVGREIRGFFFDAGFTSPSRPDPAQFRVHPLFASRSDQLADFGAGLGKRGGVGGKGTIKNPIEPRRFVEHGGQQVLGMWHRMIQAAESRFVAEIETIRASSPAVAAGGRGPRRRR